MADVESTTVCSNTTMNLTVQEGEGGNPYEQSWYVQVAYYTAFFALITCAVGGNAIVTWIVLAHRRMRTVTNYFLVNLALADLLISLLNTPLSFVYMLSSSWPFGALLCRLSTLTGTLTISASVFTLMAIAIDRYVAIIHPLRPHLSPRRVSAVIVAIWCVSVLIALPPTLHAQATTLPSPPRPVCIVVWHDGQYSATDFAYNVILLFINYIVPLVVLTVTYVKVGVSLWGSQVIGEYTHGQTETIRSKRRVVKMMIVVVVIFAVCWLPSHAFFIASNARPTLLEEMKGVQHVYLVFYWLAMSNSMYNPIIYCWMNAKFRERFQYVFRWVPGVYWTPGMGALAGGRGRATTMGGHSGPAPFSSPASNRAQRNGSAALAHTMIDSLDDMSAVHTPLALAHLNSSSSAASSCRLTGRANTPPTSCRQH